MKKKSLRHREYPECADMINVIENVAKEHKQNIPEPKSLDIAEIVKCYKAQMAIKEIADWYKINTHKVIKILVTAGVYSSKTYDAIKKLREQGISENEISANLNLSRAAMNDYTPYKKGMYNLESPSENAKKLRQWRKAKKN